MINYNCQLLIGDPPNPAGFVDDAIEVDYFIKALKTRLKYCPNEIVGITISAESARRILKALKDNDNEGGRTQEPIKPITASDEMECTWYYVCPKCKIAIDYKDKYCRHCGSEMLWDGG